MSKSRLVAILACAGVGAFLSAIALAQDKNKDGNGGRALEHVRSSGEVSVAVWRETPTGPPAGLVVTNAYKAGSQPTPGSQAGKPANPRDPGQQPGKQHGMQPGMHGTQNGMMGFGHQVVVRFPADKSLPDDFGVALLPLSRGRSEPIHGYQVFRWETGQAVENRSESAAENSKPAPSPGGMGMKIQANEVKTVPGGVRRHLETMLAVTVRPLYRQSGKGPAPKAGSNAPSSRDTGKGKTATAEHSLAEITGFEVRCIVGTSEGRPAGVTPARQTYPSGKQSEKKGKRDKAGVSLKKIDFRIPEGSLNRSRCYGVLLKPTWDKDTKALSGFDAELVYAPMHGMDGSKMSNQKQNGSQDDK